LHAAEGDQVLAQQANAQRAAVAFGKLEREQGVR